MGVQSRLNDLRIFGLLPGHRATLPRAPALRWRDTVGPPLRQKKAHRRGPARLRPIGGPVGLQDVPDSGIDDPPFEAATSRPGASQGPSRPSPARAVQGTLFDDF